LFYLTKKNYIFNEKIVLFNEKNYIFNEKNSHMPHDEQVKIAKYITDIVEKGSPQFGRITTLAMFGQCTLIVNDFIDELIRWMYDKRTYQLVMVNLSQQEGCDAHTFTQRGCADCFLYKILFGTIQVPRYNQSAYKQQIQPRRYHTHR